MLGDLFSGRAGGRAARPGQTRTTRTTKKSQQITRRPPKRSPADHPDTFFWAPFPSPPRQPLPSSLLVLLLSFTKITEVGPPPQKFVPPCVGGIQRCRDTKTPPPMWGCVKIPCPSACPSKQLSFYFTLIVLQGFGRSRKYPHLLF